MYNNQAQLYRVFLTHINDNIAILISFLILKINSDRVLLIIRGAQLMPN